MAEDDEIAADPFAEGKAAAERSEAVSHNPHEPGTVAYDRWAKGHLSVTAPDEIADDLADFA